MLRPEFMRIQPERRFDASALSTITCRGAGVRYLEAQRNASQNMNVMAMPVTHALRPLLLGLGIVVASLVPARESSRVVKVVGDPPVIDEQPIGRIVTDGGHVAFSVLVHGTVPFSYQWRKSGQPLANNTRVTGATNAVLNIDPAQGADGGNYSAVVTNTGGSITSAVVSLAVNQILRSVTLLGTTGVLVQVLGQPGEMYRIESSADFLFSTWTTNGYATNRSGIAEFVDRNTGVSRFYRPRFQLMLPVLYPAGVGLVRAYGKLNQVWRFDASDDLQHWTPLDNVTNATGWVTFSDPRDFIPLRQFYRIAPP